jgi:hypothetical protein
VPGEVVDDPATYQHRMAQDVMSYEDTITPVRVSMDGNTGDGVAGEDDNVMPDIERLVGGAAGDDISAGLERAELAGGPGNDRLSGGPGADGLEGDEGNDLLFGNGGDDSLDDGDGTPAVVDPTLPPPGNDRLDGGPGRDFLQSDRGADELIGGAGTDVTAFIRWIPQPPTAPPPPQFAAFVVSLDGLPNDGQRGAFEGDDVHGDIEEIFTGDAADLLIGSPGPDLLGGAGGDDRIEPGPGADSVNAGDGNDAVAAIDGTTDRVDCGRGNDVAEADLPGQPGGSFDVTFDCEAVTGGLSGPPSPGADRTPPRISGFRATNRRFAVRRRPVRAAAAAKPGTTFVFRLSERARVTITIARRRGGRRKATLVRPNARKGLNRVAYDGRMRRRPLPPGRYVASARAVDRAGNRSARRSLRLTVVRR